MDTHDRGQGPSWSRDIEQVHADLKNSALAHCPTGCSPRKRRLARAARSITFNPTSRRRRPTTPLWPGLTTATVRRTLIQFLCRVATSARRLIMHPPRDLPGSPHGPSSTIASPPTSHPDQLTTPRHRLDKDDVEHLAAKPADSTSPVPAAATPPAKPDYSRRSVDREAKGTGVCSVGRGRGVSAMTVGTQPKKFAARCISGATVRHWWSGGCDAVGCRLSSWLMTVARRSYGGSAACSPRTALARSDPIGGDLGGGVGPAGLAARRRG